MVSALVSGSSGPGSSPGRGHGVVFLGKTLYSQVTSQSGAYPGFYNMKRLGVFLLPPGWDASPSPG